MKSKKEYEAEIISQLNEWRTLITEMTEKAMGLQHGDRLRFQSLLDNLSFQTKMMEQHLLDLQKGAHPEWNIFKEGVEAAAANLDGAYREALAYFK